MTRIQTRTLLTTLMERVQKALEEHEKATTPFEEQVALVRLDDAASLLAGTAQRLRLG